MKIELVPIKDVIPNPENPRLIKDENFKKLVRSIKEFPQMLNIRPIVVNEEMVTLGGNMRLKACIEAGLKKVPIIRAEGLSEQQQREFIVKDNLGYGEWDWDMLANSWDMEELGHWGLTVDKWAGAEEEDGEEEDGENDREYKKQIMVHMREDDYQEALDLLKWHRKRGAYIGGIILKHLKAEKNKINL